MNEIEKVKARLVDAHPDAKIELTPPARDDGVWWLDVLSRGKRIVVQWDPAGGFGVTTPDPDSFGEGADESYPSSAKVLRRIEQLLDHEDRTSPALPVLLARLREMRGVTQEQLATKLGVRQASISGLERREDIQLSTLRKVVQALGGAIRIFAIFPEGRFPLEGVLLDADVRAEECQHPAATFYENDVFLELKSSGKIDHALAVAGRVKRKHSVLEMV